MWYSEIECVFNFCLGLLFYYRSKNEPNLKKSHFMTFRVCPGLVYNKCQDVIFRTPNNSSFIYFNSVYIIYLFPQLPWMRICLNGIVTSCLMTSYTMWSYSSLRHTHTSLPQLSLYPKDSSLSGEPPRMARRELRYDGSAPQLCVYESVMLLVGIDSHFNENRSVSQCPWVPCGR